MLRQLFTSLGKRQKRDPEIEHPDVPTNNVIPIRKRVIAEFRLADGTPLDPELAKQAALEVFYAYERRRSLDQERHAIDARIAAMFAAAPK